MRKRPLHTVAMLLALLTLVMLPTAAWASTTQRIYRLYNQWNGDHLFTRDSGERTDLMGRGWSDEGTAWEAPASGTSVWRLFNPWSGEHLYTTDKAEYDGLASRGWSREGVSLHSGGKAPVYRLYNRWLTAGTHLYTTDKAEYGRLVGLGWSGEGVKLYAEGSSSGGPGPGKPSKYANGQRLLESLGVNVGALASQAEAKGYTAAAGYTLVDADNPKSAFHLDNIRKALTIVDQTNAARAARGLPALRLTPTLMAQSAIQTNVGTKLLWHPKIFDYIGENLAWGYAYDKAVNDAWMSEESTYNKYVAEHPDKKIAWENANSLSKWCKANSDISNDVGHYLNIINPYCVAMGAAYSRLNTQWDNFEGEVFTLSLPSGERTYTTAEFRALLG